MKSIVLELVMLSETTWNHLCGAVISVVEKVEKGRRESGVRVNLSGNFN